MVSGMNFVPHISRGFRDISGGYTPSITHTMAHELGHGIFGLDHIFSGAYGIKKGVTYNLMDYTEKTPNDALSYHEWTQINRPLPSWSALSRAEEDMQVVTVTFGAGVSCIFSFGVQLGIAIDCNSGAVYALGSPNIGIETNLSVTAGEFVLTWYPDMPDAKYLEGTGFSFSIQAGELLNAGAGAAQSGGYTGISVMLSVGAGALPASVSGSLSYSLLKPLNGEAKRKALEETLNFLKNAEIDDNTRKELNIDEQIKYIESQLTNYEK